MSISVIGSRQVAKNAFRNLIGQGMPLLVAAYCIPKLIETLGIQKFGFLTLIWTIVGYLSIFDFGLGQALTKIIAEKLGKGKYSEVSEIFWSGLSAMFALGLLSIFILIPLIPIAVDEFLKIDQNFRKEAGDALQVAVICVPFVILSAGTRGVLEAYQRFDIVNWIRGVLGSYTFAVPLMVAVYYSTELPQIALMLAVGRFLFFLSTLFMCIKVLPDITPLSAPRIAVLRPLFAYGGWMTISNVVGPLMVYVDRFVIGAVLSMSAVAYYVTPYEVVTKLWILPSALMSALFSALAINLSQNRSKALQQYELATSGIFYLMFPTVVIFFILSGDLLTFWIGHEFAKQSAVVFQVLSVGVLINSYGRVPFAFVQVAGRPDIPAKLYLVELPLYLLVLWFSLNIFGVVGAAFAWVFRIVLDNIVLFLCSRSIAPDLELAVKRGLVFSIFPLPIFYAISFVSSTVERVAIILTAVVFSIFAAIRLKNSLKKNR